MMYQEMYMLIIALSTLILDWQHIATPTATVTALPVTKYLYDGDNVLADYASNEPGNALTATALYVTPELDQNLSVTAANGTTHYYTHDGLGSVRTLTNINATLVNHYDYTAFGEPYTAGTNTNIPNRYTYTGREKSPITASPMYYRWRNYTPGIGRFMWRDPIGYADGANVYGYTANLPTQLSDAHGLLAPRFYDHGTFGTTFGNNNNLPANGEFIAIWEFVDYNLKIRCKRNRNTSSEIDWQLDNQRLGWTLEARYKFESIYKKDRFWDNHIIQEDKDSVANSLNFIQNYFWDADYPYRKDLERTAAHDRKVNKFINDLNKPWILWYKKAYKNIETQMNDNVNNWYCKEDCEKIIKKIKIETEKSFNEV